MNNIRMIFCGLFLVIIASVGTIDASMVNELGENGNSYGLQEAIFIIVPPIISSQMDQKRDFGNALIDVVGSTAAYYHNQHFKIYNKSIGEQVLHLAPTSLFDLSVNYSIRKASKYFNGKGISVEVLANKCDVLPEGIIRDVVNPVAKCGANAATHPQVMTVLFTWGAINLLSMIRGG